MKWDANTVAWLSLLTAGLFEIGWPLGFKLASKPEYSIAGPAFSVLCMAVSGFLLWFSLKEIPIGTAYAVWTGIGAAGTFMVGVAFFGDPNIFIRWLGIFAIISGVVLLKLGG
jgi:quaternary ammonium compound-resistance protein SugE